MIKQVKIKNFQSHVNTVLDFHPGVNVTRGCSDCGKSATLRALKWVAQNQPSGDEYRRHDTSMTEVELDGVKKYRSASKHQYELNGKVFKALRTDVPPEVETALRLSEINFQDQHAPYFLIPDPPGQVAKTLNKVADLQVIDLTLAAIRTKVREANTQDKYLKEELQKTTEKISGLEWVEEADRDYLAIEMLVAEAAAIDTRPLHTLIDKIKRLQGEFEAIPDTVIDRLQVSKMIKGLDIDLSLAGVIQKVEENQVTIPSPKEDLLQVWKYIIELGDNLTESISSAVSKAEGYLDEVYQFPVVIDDVNEPLVDLKMAIDAHHRLEKSILEAFVAEDCLDEADRMYVEGKLEFDRKLKEVGRCPLCESVL